MAGKSLIGVTITARHSPSLWGVVGLVIAAASGAMAAVERSMDGVLLALLPLCVGIAAQINWDGAFRLEVSATGLRDRRGHPIHFANLREVRALIPPKQARRKDFPVEIVHAGGALVAPRLLSVSSEDLYDLLRERLGTRTTNLPATLTAFASEQRATFGPDRVWSWGKRAGAPRTIHSGLRSWWIGGGAAGTAWVIAAWLSPRISSSWLGIGVLAIFIAAILLAADLTGRRGSGSVAPIAGLVITPAALALHLGELEGQLTWEEIQGITYPAQSRFLAVSSTPSAIAVDVAGARILITDSFTHPLGDIHERMLRYWRSPL